MLESQALILFMEANYHPPRHYSQQLLDVFQRLKVIFFSSSLALFLTIREPEYYDYGHGETTESYESYGEQNFIHCQQRRPN